MSVELLQILSLISYILAGLFLLLAIGLFFYLKVPSLWGEVSGRTARKAIEAMKWKNEEAGPKALPTAISHEPTASKLTAKIAKANQLQAEEEEAKPKERVPLVASEQKPPLRSAPVSKTAPTESAPTPTVAPPTAPTESVMQEQSSQTGPLPLSPVGDTDKLPKTELGETSVLPKTELGETSVLPKTELGETSVLPKTELGETSVLPKAELGETSVLPKAELGETSLLPQAEIGETAVLNSAAYSEFILRSTGELPRQDETTLLDRKEAPVQSTAPVVFFVLEKELAFTDSTEIIE